jgi:hypothetical protein
MKIAAKEEVYWTANMNCNKQLQLQIPLSDTGTEAITWSLVDTERVTNHLDREIYGITSKEQKRFNKEFSIRLIAFQSRWVTIGIQELHKTFEQHVIYFR